MDFITSNNIVLITTTLYNNTISEKRRNNIKNEMEKYNIPIFFCKGIKCNQASKKGYISNIIILRKLLFFKNTKYDYGIICDDDFSPHINFLEELILTTNLLPKNWRCLHLCPGYLWVRKNRICNKNGNLHPEGNISNLEYNKSGRFFINCKSKLWVSKRLWLGGPIALLVNKYNIDSLINEYLNYYKKNENEINDVIFTNILNVNDYVCRYPLLGYENEEGGTTFIS